MTGKFIVAAGKLVVAMEKSGVATDKLAVVNEQIIFATGEINRFDWKCAVAAGKSVATATIRGNLK